MPVYQTGTDGLSISVGIHASISVTVVNRIEREDNPADEAIQHAGAVADMTVAYGGGNVGITPITKGEDLTGLYPAMRLGVDPITYSVGYRVTVNGFDDETDHEDVWVASAFVSAGSVATVSGTFNGSFTVSAGVINCFENTGDTAIPDIIDAPLGRQKVRLFQRYDYADKSASCGGASVHGVGEAGGEVGYDVGISINALASETGGGSWSFTFPSTGGFYEPEQTASTGSGTVSSTSLTLTAGPKGSATANVTGGMGCTTRPLKSFELGGEIRAMEQPYPDPLVVGCSRFNGDPAPTINVSGGGFSTSYSQKWYSFSGNINRVQLIDVNVNEWQPVSAGISSASLAAVGEDLSPPAPPPDPETGVINPFAEQGPPRATRLLMRGSKFSALSLALAADTQIDNCGSLTASTGAWEGSWGASGTFEAPEIDTSLGSGIHFVGGVKRTFTHDVSFSSYRYLRLDLIHHGEGATPPLTLRIGGKTFHVQKSTSSSGAATEYHFVDLCAEFGDGSAPYSMAGTKWPLRQNDFPLTSDGLPKFEKSYAGVSRCQGFELVGTAEADVTLQYVGLSRYPYLGETGEAVTATWLPAFYRGKKIYEQGPDAQATDLDKHWPTREYPQRDFGGDTPPRDPDPYLEDLSGQYDEVDGYDDMLSGTGDGGDNESDAPGKTKYWARRFLLANVNGRQGLEEKDSAYQVTETELTKFLSESEVTIAELVSRINAVNTNGTILNPGWTATSLKPRPNSCNAPAPLPPGWLPDYNDCYLCDEQPAVWLHGGGALAGENGWQYGFDRPLGDVDAQQLFDEVQWYPYAGDFFHLGSGGGIGGVPGPLILRAATILRGAGHGLTLTTAKKAAAGKAVDVLQGTVSETPPPTPPLVVVSSGVSGANGWYKTSSSPFAKTPQPGDVRSGTASTSRVSFEKLYGRKRNRAVLLVTVPHDPTPGIHVANFVERYVGWYAEAYITADGDLVWRKTTNSVPSFPSDFLPLVTIAPAPGEGLDLSSPDIYMEPHGRLRVRWAQSGETGAGVYEATSDSAGKTWTGGTLVAEGAQFPVFGEGITSGPGQVVSAYFLPADGDDVTTGTIKATTQTSGSVPSALFTFQTGGVDLVIEGNGFDLRQALEGGARWYLTCIFQGEDTPSTWYSADTCKTWTRI